MKRNSSVEEGIEQSPIAVDYCVSVKTLTVLSTKSGRHAIRQAISSLMRLKAIDSLVSVSSHWDRCPGDVYVHGRDRTHTTE